MNDHRFRACVLLSTYNGAAYLEPLLDSLLAQSHPDVTVLVRDDGSKDSTLDILARYAGRHASVRVTPGQNLGVVRSFFELLESAGPEYDAWFFCDQDDVWLAQKIEVAMAAISSIPENVPGMYCSRVEYVDDRDKSLGVSVLPGHIGMNNALVENIASGCTIALTVQLVSCF